MDRRGVQRGTAFPLAGGFQRRAAPSLAHDFPTESLVCYTFASGCRREGADCGICNLGRWAAGRHFSAAVGYTFASGCRREGADCGICNLGRWAAGRHFSAAVGQADFVRSRTKSGFAHRAKSAWTEKEAKVYQLPSRRSDSTLVSLLLPWTSHGSYRHCTGSCTVGCKKRRWTGCPGTPSDNACTGAEAGHRPPA